MKKPDLKNFGKRIVRIAKGLELPIRPQVQISKEWIGSDYGGFYLHTDSLDRNSIIYSFGIGTDISFDKALIDVYNCSVYGFDPTPKSISWIRNQGKIKNFNFFEYGIDTKTGNKFFFLPKNEDHVSGSLISHGNVSGVSKIEVSMKKFDDIIASLQHNRIDILKMDIEGTEFDILPDILASNIHIDQFAIEFHQRFVKEGKRKVMEMIQLLNKNNYFIYGMSNSQEEISFKKII